MADKIINTWNDYAICPTCADGWINGTEGVYGLSDRAEKWIADHRANFTITILADLCIFGLCDLCNEDTCVFGAALNEWA